MEGSDLRPSSSSMGIGDTNNNSPTSGTKLIVVVGPTASGKSELALSLCEALGGEIVNADSVQMYEGLPIATNKPSPAELSRARHHLVGVLPPSETGFNANAFVRAADEAIRDITGRGKVAVVVGGTHYYVQQLLLGAASGETDADQDTGGDTTADAGAARDLGGETPHERLRRIDPVMAARWHPNDTRRILNSISVFERTGRPHSEILAEAQAQAQVPRARYDACILCLATERMVRPGGQAAKTKADSRTGPDAAAGDDSAAIRSRVAAMARAGIAREVFSFFLQHDPRATTLATVATNGASEAEGDVDAQTSGISSLLPAEGRTSGTVLEAIGYREFLPWCESLVARGVRDPDDPAVIAAVASNATEATTTGTEDAKGNDDTALLSDALSRLAITTRRYARRQAMWIRNKLLPCNSWSAYVFPPAEHGVAGNRERFAEGTVRPATVIARAFLSGARPGSDLEECHAARRFVGDAAAAAAAGKGKGSDRAVLGAPLSQFAEVRTCDPCGGRTFYGDHAWALHAASRKHSKAVSRRARIQSELERAGFSSPEEARAKRARILGGDGGVGEEGKERCGDGDAAAKEVQEEEVEEEEREERVVGQEEEKGRRGGK